MYQPLSEGNGTVRVVSQQIKYCTSFFLWDGMNCTLLEPACCKSLRLPYFHAKITVVTTDPIELRSCHDQGCDDEDVPIESYEFYVR